MKRNKELREAQGGYVSLKGFFVGMAIGKAVGNAVGKACFTYATREEASLANMAVAYQAEASFNTSGLSNSDKTAAATARNLTFAKKCIDALQITPQNAADKLHPQTGVLQNFSMLHRAESGEVFNAVRKCLEKVPTSKSGSGLNRHRSPQIYEMIHDELGVQLPKKFLDLKEKKWVKAFKMLPGNKVPPTFIPLQPKEKAKKQKVEEDSDDSEDDDSSREEDGAAAEDDSQCFSARGVCKSESSNKFWEVKVEVDGDAGASMVVRYGKVGTTGAAITKTFADVAMATKDAKHRWRQKQAKGYIMQADQVKNAGGGQRAGKKRKAAEL